MPVEILDWRKQGRIPLPFDPYKGVKIMKVKMIKTMKGSPDGIQVNEYEAGKEYDLPEGLANNFLGQDVAKKNKEKKGPEENKDLAGSEENKELERAEEIKEEERLAEEDKEPEAPEETKEEEERPIEEETKPKKEEKKKKK